MTLYIAIINREDAYGDLDGNVYVEVKKIEILDITKKDKDIDKDIKMKK